MGSPSPIEAGGTTLRFDTPILMGILNITPDSFSDGGELTHPRQAVERASQMVQSGARVIDVGGESTRPGSAPVTTNEEKSRVLPVIEALANAELPVAISIDTSKSSVARAALHAGASIVNDVTGLGDKDMAQVVAELGAALIVMHMRGTPETMQAEPVVYDDLMGTIRNSLASSVQRAVDAGVPSYRIMVDPGIGFGKELDHNLEITRRIGELSSLGQANHAIVFGPSRKRFLGAITGRPAHDRDRATAAACVAAAMSGAHVFRVHDVEAVRDGLQVAAALRA